LRILDAGLKLRRGNRTFLYFNRDKETEKPLQDEKKDDASTLPPDDRVLVLISAAFPFIASQPVGFFQFLFFLTLFRGVFFQGLQKPFPCDILLYFKIF